MWPDPCPLFRPGMPGWGFLFFRFGAHARDVRIHAPYLICAFPFFHCVSFLDFWILGFFFLLFLDFPYTRVTLFLSCGLFFSFLPFLFRSYWSLSSSLLSAICIRISDRWTGFDSTRLSHCTPPHLTLLLSINDFNYQVWPQSSSPPPCSQGRILSSFVFLVIHIQCCICINVSPHFPIPLSALRFSSPLLSLLLLYLDFLVLRLYSSVLFLFLLALHYPVST